MVALNYKDYSEAIARSLCHASTQYHGHGHGSLARAYDRWARIVEFLKSKPIILDDIVRQMEEQEKLDANPQT